MVKIREDSRIEIWAGKYINNPDIRDEKDKNKVIIQIEAVPTSPTPAYIVEVVNG